MGWAGLCVFDKPRGKGGPKVVVWELERVGLLRVVAQALLFLVAVQKYMQALNEHKSRARRRCASIWPDAYWGKERHVSCARARKCATVSGHN